MPAGATDYDIDYGYFWTNTSAYFGGDSQEYYYAWYVAFGSAVGQDGADFHGAGAARFDTKIEGGPLGEGGERYYNYVRLVRGASTATCQQLVNSGDFNADCKINLLDFALLAGEWLESDCEECNGKDITDDGNIDLDDLIYFVNGWLEGA